MVDFPDKASISYQCNQCNKKRKVFVPSSVKVTVDSRGLCELVDVHQCRESNLTANILFIDSFYVVRSQVHVGSDNQTIDKKEELFSIPKPEKLDITTKEIPLVEHFKAKYIRELEINDGLRQLKYGVKLIRTRNFEHVRASSQLGFIKISSILTDEIVRENASDWYQVLANILESVAQFDDNILPYILVFLDERIYNYPTDKEISELEILIRSPISLPHTNQRAIAVFKEQRKDLFKNLDPSEYTDYSNILTNCFNNETDSILDIYEQMKMHIDLNFFLSAIRKLSQKALINIDRLEFFTISDS
ncbi:MAG: hypothetical protein HGN29_05875 [Asgard group archaeon]|nr:hypothetical protein [Asgard group archaeon]